MQSARRALMTAEPLRGSEPGGRPAAANGGEEHDGFEQVLLEGCSPSGSHPPDPPVPPAVSPLLVTARQVPHCEKSAARRPMFANYTGSDTPGARGRRRGDDTAAGPADRPDTGRKVGLERRERRGQARGAERGRGALWPRDAGRGSRRPRPAAAGRRGAVVAGEPRQRGAPGAGGCAPRRDRGTADLRLRLGGWPAREGCPPARQRAPGGVGTPWPCDAALLTLGTARLGTLPAAHGPPVWPGRRGPPGACSSASRRAQRAAQQPGRLCAAALRRRGLHHERDSGRRARACLSGADLGRQGRPPRRTPSRSRSACTWSPSSRSPRRSCTPTRT